MTSEEVKSIFNSAILKLRTRFGAEMETLSISFDPTLDNAAICKSYWSKSKGFESIIHLSPETIIAESRGWSEDTLRNSLLILACHETSHHLHAFRETSKIKPSKIPAWLSETEEHPADWISIMQNEMGCPIRFQWSPVRIVPAVFAL